MRRRQPEVFPVDGETYSSFTSTIKTSRHSRNAHAAEAYFSLLPAQLPAPLPRSRTRDSESRRPAEAAPVENQLVPW